VTAQRARTARQNAASRQRTTRTDRHPRRADEPAAGDLTPWIEDERYGRRPVANLKAASAESVARSVCGLVHTTTVLSRCDRRADE